MNHKKQVAPKAGTHVYKVLTTLSGSTDPVSTKDLMIYTDLSKQSVHSCISALKSRYRYDILTIQLPREPRPSNGPNPVAYLLKSSTPLPKIQPITTSITTSKPVSKTYSNGLCSLTDRAMHLIKAKHTVSSGYVEDFFDLSSEEARVLLNKVAHSYKNDIKLTITATVRPKR